MDTMSPMLESDVPDENSDSVEATNKCIVVLTPVAIGESGEGSPYAPANWPNPGDMWRWKVGRRITNNGYFQDRFLVPPPHLKRSFNGKPYIASKKALEEYVRNEYPDTDFDALMSSFSWKIPSNSHDWGKDGVPVTSISRKEEMGEHSGYDSKIETMNCKARNKRCRRELEEKEDSQPTIACDLCCSEIGFCRDCCCILCCKTIDWSDGGFSFIRCESNIDEDYICGHVAHINCALRSYMAGTVGGSIGLDAEYYCRRCDNRTDLIPYVVQLLDNQSIDSSDENEKILNTCLCILRGSARDGAKTLQNRINLALSKVKSGIYLDEIWNAEDSVPAEEQLDLGNNGDFCGCLELANNHDHNMSNHELSNIEQRGEEPVYITSDHRIESSKLDEEVDKVLQELKKSQEEEYEIAERRLYDKKDFILGLYRLLDLERSELATRTPSTTDSDADVLLVDVLNRARQINGEVQKLKYMKEVAKGFGKVSKRILREHFDLQCDD